jgi:hypothetical protein
MAAARAARRFVSTGQPSRAAHAREAHEHLKKFETGLRRRRLLHHITGVKNFLPSEKSLI